MPCKRFGGPSRRVSFVFAKLMCKVGVFFVYQAGSSMKAVLQFLGLTLAVCAIPLQLSAQSPLTRPSDAPVVVLISEQEAALPAAKKGPVALAANSAPEDRAINSAARVPPLQGGSQGFESLIAQLPHRGN